MRAILSNNTKQNKVISIIYLLFSLLESLLEIIDESFSFALSNITERTLFLQIESK